MPEDDDVFSRLGNIDSAGLGDGFEKSDRPLERNSAGTFNRTQDVDELARKFHHLDGNLRVDQKILPQAADERLFDLVQRQTADPQSPDQGKCDEPIVPYAHVSLGEVGLLEYQNR